MTQIVNELLCVLKCNFGKYPRANLLSTFADFYSDEEIEAAKSVIVEFAENCTPKVDELKNIKPRVGDGRNRRIIEDIFNIYAALDVKKVKLPQIVAADTNRIPSIREIDFGKISAKIIEVNNSLSAEIQKLGQQLSGDINQMKTSTDQVFHEIKTNMQTVTSDAVQAIKSSSNDAKEAIFKQTMELSSITTAVDQIKSAAKQTESYADKLMSSSSV